MTAATNYTAGDARSISGAMNTVGTDSNSTLDGTGWRNITTYLASGASSTTVHIIRRGYEVKVRALGAATTSLNWITGLPVGWRPPANTSTKVLGADLIIGTAGSINFLANATLSASTWIEFTYEASGAFPTSGLPGTAV